MRVLFVCLGNICRSPMAEAVFRAEAERRGLTDRIDCDSAGTGAWHRGQPPDPRSLDALSARGYDGTAQRARQVESVDFAAFDLILAMDEDNLKTLQDRAPDAAARSRIHLFLSILDDAEINMPDPYYGGPDGFSHVLDRVEHGVKAWLDRAERDLR